jgi:hemin uptake protein HemP
MSVKYKVELKTHLLNFLTKRSLTDCLFGGQTKGQGPIARMTPTANSQKRRLTIAPAVRTRAGFGERIHREPKREQKTEFDSRELFSGLRQIQIVHNEETYRLSITKQGKLILTK